MSRPIKKLLTLLKSSIVKDENFKGMCWNTNGLYCRGIDLEELARLDDYIDNNKPDGCERIYWWTKGVKAPRLKWLSERIRIEKKKS